jgi:hypothetical protein
MEGLFPLEADRAGVVVIMPVTLSIVTNINVRGTSTFWTSTLTLIHAELSPVKVSTLPKVSKRYPNPGASHGRIGTHFSQNAQEMPEF